MSDKIETITYDKFKKLKVGLNRITFGMEHGNEKFRRSGQSTNKLAIELMQIPTELDIPFSVNNIGFPGETRELLLTQ